MQNLPDKLYTVKSIVQIEQLAIKRFNIPAFELMKRAGEVVFDVVRTKLPQNKKILILCGAGNNAGDGYVIAKLAKQAGYKVYVISLIDTNVLKKEALQACKEWLEISENSVADKSLLEGADIIIDALLGTGLSREVSLEWQQWIAAINNVKTPVISVDVPSGLNADTGVIAGDAIKADVTVSFIGLKQGMFTAQAKDVCGEIIFNNLGLPEKVYESVKSDAELLNGINYLLLPKRKASAHKGCFGHVLLVGGNDGMPGALILAATAALRTGAGLLTILTVEKNLSAISAAIPEAMVKTCNVNSIASLFDDAFCASITHIAIGMGLGQDKWSETVLAYCLKMNKPMLIDADALNLVAKNNMNIASPLIITPHPGEAARLLTAEQTVSSADVQHNRFGAIKRLNHIYRTNESNVVILKGSGTLIYDSLKMKVCNLGSVAMATPGMGDVLSGICISLMAQNLSLTDSAELAVCLHAAAADAVVDDKSRGLLASDVVSALSRVLQ